MIKLLILLTLTKVIGGSLPPDDADNVLHIGGIFPIGGKGGWQGGQVSNKYYIIFLRCIEETRKLGEIITQCTPVLGTNPNWIRSDNSILP